jgi:hypothetical protein
LFAAFLPERLRREKEYDGDPESHWKRDPTAWVGERPGCSHGGCQSDATRGERETRVHAGRAIECEGGERKYRFVDDGNPSRESDRADERGAYEIERKQEPSGGPNQEVGLALLLVDVNEKCTEQKGAGEEHDRTRIEVTQQLKTPCSGRCRFLLRIAEN